MKNVRGRTALLSLLVIAVVIPLAFLYKRGSRPKMMLQFGQYWGYSAEVYDGSERRSEYLTLEKGIRLAYDLILPTQDGVPSQEPLPVLLNYTPYLRTFTIFDQDGKLLLEELYDLRWYEKIMLRFRRKVYDRGHLMDPLFRTRWLENMLQRGYAVIVVERPGTGASFGTMDPSFEVGASEVNEILDWIAAQDWCDGNIGMFGDSWQAMIQFAAASTGNPHLKAILPISSSIDSYGAVNYPGGIYNTAFNSFFSGVNAMLEGLVTPVDADQDGELLRQALAERSGSTVGEESADFLTQYPFRDSVNARGEAVWEEVMALYPFLDRINRAEVPIYMVSGWYDLFPADMFLWYANLTVPRRLTVRPVDHGEMEGDGPSDLDFGAEAHRWFDYWLKGIDNGIMDEPPIHYYVLNAPRKNAWQTSDRWPLEEQHVASFHLSAGRAGSVASINDGFLRLESPGVANGYDGYTVDYTTTSGAQSRWMAVLEARNYSDMRRNDEKALTYTTASLERDVKVTGHPVAHVWIETDSPDLDLFVYLEHVDARGRSTYVTEGELRASHRSLGAAPYDNLGLPYHRHYESDLMQIPAGQPVELVLDLLPTSYLFPAGSRIRITIAFADADNFATPKLDPAPEIHLRRDTAHPSFVELPIVAGS